MILKPRLFRKPRKGHWASKGLVGLWLFNEGSGGQVFDLSGNRNTGVFVGSPVWAPGKFGSAVNFPGTGSGAYIDCGDPINPSGGSLSVSLWVNFQDLAASTEQIIGNGDNDDDDNGWMIYWYDGDIQFQISHSEGGLKTILTSYTTNNQWVHIFASFDNVTKLSSLYLDSVLKVSNTVGGNYVNSSDNLVIGANAGGDNLREFEGLIDNVMYWNRVLSASEIAQVYREPFCMFQRDPIELWSAATLGAPPVGMVGAMTTNSGYWGW